uniref:Secreted protein n=1 Tax=Oryza brachyantha TaxID=4533 RepID=J3L9G6_ORYBR
MRMLVFAVTCCVTMAGFGRVLDDQSRRRAEDGGGGKGDDGIAAVPPASRRRHPLRHAPIQLMHSHGIRLFVPICSLALLPFASRVPKLQYVDNQTHLFACAHTYKPKSGFFQS